MKSILLILAASPMLAATVLQTPATQLKTHADKMLAAPGVSMKLSVTPIGGNPTEATVTMLKPNMVRISLPDREIVSDGKTLWTLDRKASTYIESPATELTALQSMDDNVWAWSAFFDAKFVEGISTSKPGKARKMKGFGVKELDVNFVKRTNVSATLLLDDVLGVARGFIFRSTSNGTPVDTIVFAEELNLNYKAAASDFVFAPGRGVTKAEKPVSSGLVWKDVEPIFMGNCAGCHGSQASGGVRLTTYESVMAGRRGRAIVVAGDVASSSLIKNLRGQAKVMPPSGSMPEAVIGKIEQWIKDGAKKE